MKILVLLAGVADNRYPLHSIALDDQSGVAESGQARRQLSPFDEGALELALKLRDTNDDVQIDVLVLEGLGDDNTLRAVAAFKPDRVRRISPQPTRLWDAAFSATQLADAIRGDGIEPDLILIGREFGDQDEGSLSVMLAAHLQYPRFELVQFAHWQEGDVRLMRESGVEREWLTLDRPLLASVTNDKRNKLRHPLMKNVMMAKRQSFDTLVAPLNPGGDAAPEPLQLAELSMAPSVQRDVQCRMLEGSVREQAQALAALLRDRV